MKSKEGYIVEGNSIIKGKEGHAIKSNSMDGIVFKPEADSEGS